MTVAEAIQVQAVRRLFDYNAETGVFTRATSSRRWKAGSEAGSINAIGYVQIGIGQRRYGAHRLAWLYVHGEWPSGEIDHINGNRADNRIANLRDVSRAQNNQNKRKALSNNISSGLLGVYWHRQKGKWRAQIQVDGKAKHLGLFATKEEANTAYQAAKRELHPFSPEAAHGSRH